MLQNIHEKITGWFAWVILGLIAIAFVFWGVEYYLERGVGNREVVAKVGDQKISAQQLQVTFQRIQAQAQQRQGGLLSSEQTKLLKQYALEGLINQAVLVQGAHDAGFAVSDAGLQGIVVSDPTFQVNGHFSQSKFQQFLMSMGLSPSVFMQRLRDSVITQQVQLGVQSSAFVLPEALNHLYALTHQTRDFIYATLPTARFVHQVKLTTQDLQKYYQQNMAMFKTPAKVKAQYIVLSPQNIADSVHITEAQVKSYYEGNLGNFTLPKRWQIEQLAVKTKKEAEQAYQKAKKTGQLPQASAKVWVSEDQAQGALASLLNGLKAGQISQPFQTKQGYAFIKLVAVQPAKTKTYAEVRSRIYRMIRQQRMEQILTQQSDQLSNLTYTNPNTLQPAAKALKVPVQATAWMTRQGEKQGIFSNANVLAALFSSDVMQGNNSNPISLKDGTVVVVRAADQQPSKALPFKQVEAKIREQLTQQQAKNKAGVVAYQIQTALQKGELPATAAKHHGLVWREASNIPSNSKAVKPAILKEAFSVPPRKAAVSLGAQGDYTIVFVKNVRRARAGKENDKVLSKLRQQVSGLHGQIDYQLYAKSLHDHIKVKQYK